MNCDAYRILVSAYIDGELSEEESQRLKTHLNACESCFQYLQKQERVQAALKRYTLVQEAPAVPLNFASRIAQQLEEQFPKVPEPSVAEQLKERFRANILSVVDAWIGSLKVRPFAWTAAMSCFFVLFGALLLNELSSQQSAHAPANLVAAVSETASLDDISAESLIQFDDTELAGQNSDLDGSEFIVIAGLNDESPAPAARKKMDPMQDYIYSHVVEAYQDRLLEDAMLVGYAQNADFIQ